MRGLSPRVTLSAALIAAGLVLAGGAAAEPVVGSEAPLFELPSLDGESVALADFENRLVVLHFGAGW